MSNLILDIETTGFLRKGNRVHCIVTKDLETDQVQVYDDRPDRTIELAKRDLEQADSIIGHNLIDFDVPFLEEIWPDFERPPIWDTLVLSRLFFADMSERDHRTRPEGMPVSLFGSHSLKAWGYRLGILKGKFIEEHGFETYTPEMLSYCKQDVEVTAALWEVMERKLDQLKTLSAPQMEHTLAVYMAEQEKYGFPFDLARAEDVRAELQEKFNTLQKSLQDQFFMVPDVEWTPKRDNKAKGYRNGAPMTKLKDFNPTSRPQLAWVLTTRLGMFLDKKTETGRDKLDEATLDELCDSATEEIKPILQQFTELFKLQKWLGQLSNGENSWLNKVEQDGCIHHSCFLGTATGRQAHSGPNLGQVVSAPWARQLFKPHPGHVMVGADLQGLELRCLGHYLAKHDGGAFAKVVVEGDIHQQNADRVGCTRKEVKSLTYAFCYGAGDLKLGHTFNPGASDARKLAIGSEIRSKFLKAIPGLDPLITKVKQTVRTHGVLPGLDGRYIPCQAQHASLNYLLQSAGAILSKRYVLFIHEMLADAGLTHGRDYISCAYVHDEVQLSVHPDLVEVVSEICEEAAIRAGQFYNFRVPITAEAKSGMTWAETH
jgi:hypothetical protein